ncbi:nucleotidyltransferase domain-containing protein [soil metagenome]|jgi:predicted nucleotidyltransferase|nr:nucleotidyltransferase domain-containing protein [Chthoniobacterales bacterium]
MFGYKPSLPQLTAELREEIVERIVAAVDPEKIVLFGSRAEETHRPDSDIDLLVVRESAEPSYKRAIPIHAAIWDLPIEVDTDVLVYTPQEVEEWKGASAAFVTTALRQGKVIYERQR